MPHTSHRSWIDIQKKHAGFHHPALRSDPDTDWVPNTDVIEQADGLVIRLEVAGVEERSIHVVATASALIVTGQRPNPHASSTAAGYRFRQMEIEYGPFERVISLPFAIDRQLAQARIHGGILEIQLHKAVSGLRRKTVIELSW
jgi:HSP20 family protein